MPSSRGASSTVFVLTGLIGIGLLTLMGCQPSSTPESSSPSDASSGAAPSADDVANEALPDSLRPVRVTAAGFRQLQWLEGTWRGTGGELDGPFYEAYRMRGDSVLAFQTYTDSTLSQVSSQGRIVRADGEMIFRSGQNVWVATSLRDDRVRFAPRENVDNTFTWTRTSESSWEAVLAYPNPNGPVRERVYRLTQMHPEAPFE